VIAGQGTIALEILDQLDPAAIFVPIGGGGLIAGIALAIKELKPKIQVIGVEPELENDAFQTFKSGKLVALPAASNSIAEAIRVQSLGNIPFQIIQKCVDDIVLVSEGEIARASLLILEKNHIIVEPSGSLGLAAALKFQGNIQMGKPVVFIASGGNIQLEKLLELMGQI
jgi:threonine dehydratase